MRSANIRSRSLGPERYDGKSPVLRVQDPSNHESIPSGGTPRYAVQLPCCEDRSMGQDEAYFYLTEGGDRKKIRFHDYDEIYRRPGLYEQLFYDRLKCTSPARMAEWLRKSCEEAGAETHTLRVLDLGAGNGMVGEAIFSYGVARMVGIDILPEAKIAQERDRAGVYDAYYVADLTQPSSDLLKELCAWQFDCLMCVAALGFGDIPPRAFMAGFDLIEVGGWVCFNIKETFLAESDVSGFSRLVRRMWQSGMLDIHRMVRYRHRYSINGEPLQYFGIVGRKTEIPWRELGDKAP